MTPEIKHRIGQIRRGEMPEGYNRVRDSIIPSDWKQYCLGELGKNKNGLNCIRILSPHLRWGTRWSRSFA